MLAAAGGACAVSWLLIPQLKAAQTAAAAATDRLLQAHRDGYEIPDVEQPTEHHEPPPLPGSVLLALDDYDDEGRAWYEARARRLQAKGYGPEAILRALWSPAEDLVQ